MAENELNQDAPQDEAASYSDIFDEAVTDLEGTAHADPEADNEPSEEEANEEALAQEPEDQKPSDPWVNASPEMLAERDRLNEQVTQVQNDNKAMAGRVSSLQREINALKTPNHEREGLSVEERVAELEKGSEAQQERQEEERIQSELQSLEKEFPDWAETFEKNAEAYEAWIKSQPPGIQAMDAGLEADFKAQDAGFLYSQFKAHLDEKSKQANPEPAPQNEDPKPVVPDPKTEAHNKRRERQLQAANNPKLNSPGATSGIPDDEDAAFDFFAKEFDT